MQASAAPADLDIRRPLALVAPGKGGQRIVARNRAAQQAGLVVGELLSNARSKARDLQTHDADPAADAAALRKLALWALRYAPVVAPWDDACGADGLFLDVTGATHLLGGEAALLADLDRRLRAFGLVPRLAIAGTAGAAWAMARYGDNPCAIVPPGSERAALERLPLAALRLGEDAQLALHRLGFRRIGEVIDQPRAPFAARFDAAFLRRFDQALGRAPEPLIPVVPPPLYRAQAMFLEPIQAQEHVLEAATRLLATLAEDLARDGAGARVVRLLLFRVVSKIRFPSDDGVVSLDLGLAAPSRDVGHIARLIALQLDRRGSDLDAEFGFEAAAVHVLVAERLADRQARLEVGGESLPADGLARLVDRLNHRLGKGAARRLHPRRSHTPERAVRIGDAASPSPPVGEDGGEEWVASPAPRPVLLLPQPETAEVLALIPDGPPRHFRWRGVLHQVAGAQGPERITPEWWHRPGPRGPEAARDYYVVEDMEGRRFWLYRAGLYGRGEPAPPQWFVHGVFA